MEFDALWMVSDVTLKQLAALRLVFPQPAFRKVLKEKLQARASARVAANGGPVSVLVAGAMRIKRGLILNVISLSTFFLSRKRVLNVYSLRIRTFFSCIAQAQILSSESFSFAEECLGQVEPQLPTLRPSKRAVQLSKNMPQSEGSESLFEVVLMLRSHCYS